MTPSSPKNRNGKKGTIQLVAALAIVVVLIVIFSVTYVALTMPPATNSIAYSTSYQSNETTVLSTTFVSSSLQGASTLPSTSTASKASSLSMSITSSTFTSATSTRGGALILIQDYAFSPSVAIVVIGANNTVTWTNEGAAVHTVSSDTGLFSSGDLTHGRSWNFTFTTPGNYSYYCEIHTGMTGTIVVHSASK